MVVLSLCDGISCGRLAFERAGIKIDKYYASEIDKNAISISKKNWNDIIYLGDIRNLNGSDFQDVDMIIGGTPCTNLSFSGKREGLVTQTKQIVSSLKQYLQLKSEGVEFLGQSYLFWEYVRLLREIKPKYFMLENVKMAKQWEGIINKALDVTPTFINSRLLSAQDRKRLYWANFPIQSPEDKQITVQSIIGEGNLIGAMRGRRINEQGKRDDNRLDIPIEQQIECRKDNKSNCVTTVSKDNVIITSRERFFPALKNRDKWRYLTAEETEQLQTLPIGYTDTGVLKKNARIKTIGNCWTISVISHIFSFIPKEKE